MKRIIYSLAAVAILMFASCKGTSLNANSESESDSLSLATYVFNDSTEYSQTSISFVAPSGDDKASEAIRSTLIAYIENSIAQVEGLTDKSSKSYDKNDGQGAVDYYGKSAAASLEEASKAEFDSMTAEGNAEYYIPYSIELRTNKNYEDSKVIVFSVETVMFWGGLHPQYTSFYFTFTKSDGKIQENIINEDKVAEMQDILRKGVASYFKENDPEFNEANLDEELMLGESTEIPLPACQPYPTEKGLTFFYQTYEIAPYASGTPEFTVSFEEIAPYLSEEAKQLFDYKLTPAK